MMRGGAREDAAWAGTTAVSDAHGVVGLNLVVAGRTRRFRLPIDSARHIAVSLAEALAAYDARTKVQSARSSGRPISAESSPSGREIGMAADQIVDRHLRRREFPAKVKQAALHRCKAAGGVCECHLMPHVPGLIPGGCGRKIGPGNAFFEHIAADGAGGLPTLDNCAVLVKTCFTIKKNLYDQRTVATVRRQERAAFGIRDRRGPPMPGSRDSGWKRPIGAYRAERRP